MCVCVRGWGCMYLCMCVYIIIKGKNVQEIFVMSSGITTTSHFSPF